MTGDERMMDGGVYGLDGEGRTDFYLQESGPGINEAEGVPMTFCLVIVTGSSTYTLTELSPDDAIRVGKFLIEVAKEVKRRDRDFS